MVAQILHIVFRTTIGQIQIVRLRRIFGGQRIDLLHDRDDTVLLTELAYLHHAFFYIPFKAEGTGDLEIGEALHFRLANEFRVQTPTLDTFHIEGAQLLIGLHDSVKFLQEPLVDLRQFMYLVDGISGTECFRDNKDAGIGRFMERLVDVGDHQLLVFHEAVHALSDHTQTLLNRLFEGTTNRHHLAHRFHARPQFACHTVELAQIPTRDLADHIIESRFEESACRLRHRVFQVEQAVTQSQLGSDERQWIAGCLGGQRR